MLKLFTAAVVEDKSPAMVMTGDGLRPKTALEHAFETEKTLCGLPEETLVIMRRHWSPRTKPACGVCRAIFETTYAPSGIPADYPS